MELSPFSLSLSLSLSLSRSLSLHLPSAPNPSHSHAWCTSLPPAHLYPRRQHKHLNPDLVALPCIAFKHQLLRQLLHLRILLLAFLLRAFKLPLQGFELQRCT